MGCLRMVEKVVRVVLYARVSKDAASDDGSFQEPENQLLPLRQYVAARGWELVDEFVDRMSGGAANRPAFQRMMGGVRAKRFDVVCVWSLDRFSRESMVATMNYVKVLNTYNCGLVSLQESWLDTTNEGVGQLLLAIFAWVAAQERLKISERTKAALRRKKAQGVRLGRPPKKK